MRKQNEPALIPKDEQAALDFLKLHDSVQQLVLHFLDLQELHVLSQSSQLVRTIVCRTIKELKANDGALSFTSLAGLIIKACDIFPEADSFIILVNTCNIKKAMESFSMLPPWARRLTVQHSSAKDYIDPTACEAAIQRFLAATASIEVLRCKWSLPMGIHSATCFLQRHPSAIFLHILASPLPAALQLDLRGLEELVVEGWAAYSEDTGMFVLPHCDISCLSAAQKLTSLTMLNSGLPQQAFACAALRELASTGYDCPDQVMDLGGITALKMLHKLQLESVECVGGSLAALASLPLLDELVVGSLEVPAGSTAVLAALTSLKAISSLTGAALAPGQLATMMPALQQLDACYEVALASLDLVRALRGHPGLVLLALGCISQGLEWEPCLRDIPLLQELQLGLTRQPRELLRDIAACRGITRLDFSHDYCQQAAEDVITACTSFLSLLSSSLRELDLMNIRGLCCSTHVLPLVRGSTGLCKLAAFVDAAPGSTGAEVQLSLEGQGLEVLSSEEIPARVMRWDMVDWEGRVRMPGGQEVQLALQWRQQVPQRDKGMQLGSAKQGLPSWCSVLVGAVLTILLIVGWGALCWGALCWTLGAGGRPPAGG